MKTFQVNMKTFYKYKHYLHILESGFVRVKELEETMDEPRFELHKVSMLQCIAQQKDVLKIPI